MSCWSTFGMHSPTIGGLRVLLSVSATSRCASALESTDPEPSARRSAVDCGREQNGNAGGEKGGGAA